MVTAGTYTSHDILWSDHRPVTCDFQVQVRVADEEKRKVELAQVKSELDKLDEDWAPSIEVDQLEVDFGDTRYGHSVALLTGPIRPSSHSCFDTAQQGSSTGQIWLQSTGRKGDM